MFFRGQPQTTTTVHIHQAPPQQVQTGQPTAGQPLVCVQPVMGQSVVGGYGHNNGYGVQSFSVVAPVVRRNRASVSCCGHTTVWTMLSIGILMLVTGSILMGIFSNQDVRSDRITAYNEYVEKWGAFIERKSTASPSSQSSRACTANRTTLRVNSTWLAKSGESRSSWKRIRLMSWRIPKAAAQSSFPWSPSTSSRKTTSTFRTSRRSSAISTTTSSGEIPRLMTTRTSTRSRAASRRLDPTSATTALTSATTRTTATFTADGATIRW